MRVCQPCPAARKYPSTCGERRMWICTLASAFFGRPPRRVSVPCAGLNALLPTAISARSNCSLVHSGAASRSSQTLLEPSVFAGIAFPHRNDVAIRATRGPDQHDQAPIQKAVGLEPRFTIVLSIIQQREGHSGEDPRGVLEIQSPLSKSLLSFGGAIDGLHGIYMPTENQSVKIL